MIKTYRSEIIKRFNTAKLKDEESSAQYRSKLEFQLKIIPLPNLGMDDNWNAISSAMTKSADEALGPYKPEPKNSWFGKECERATAFENEVYKCMVNPRTRTTEEYRDLRRAEKHTHRRKKRQARNSELMGIHEMRNRNDSRSFYYKVNQARKPFKPKLNACKTKDGTLLIEEKDILERWKEQLGCKRVSYLTINHQNTTSNEPPDEHEIILALEGLKNNKTPGYDSLSAELFKHGGSDLIKCLQDLLLDVFAEGQCRKPGDQLNCENHRGISLLPIDFKILS